MRKQLRTNIGALCTAMVLGYSANASAFAIESCFVPLASAACTANINTLTQGWDGPGLGSFNLGYYIGNAGQPNNGLPTGLTEAQVEGAFLAAAATWSSVVQVSFTKLGDVTLGAAGAFQNNSIDFYFHTTGSEGIPFDGAWNPSTGAGSVFAHSWGPKDIMTEITAGNMHFDQAEHWVLSGAPNPTLAMTSVNIDLQTVILHELGHVLGLDHTAGSSLSDPVMQALYWGQQRTLRADDIAGMQTLYCPTGQTCGTISPPSVPEPGTLLLLGLGLAALRLTKRQARP
jgi:hypothetical protein